MSTVSIPLTDEMKTFVDSQIVRAGYSTAAEYLHALIRDAQKRQAEEELEAKLLEGLQGPLTEMTREDWEAIRRDALAGLAGESIRQ